MAEQFEFDDNLYLNDNTGISVGFRSDLAIAPLRSMLEELFAKQVESNRRYLNEQEQKHKNETNKNAKQAHDDAVMLIDRAKYAETQRVKLSSHMENISKEMRNIGQKYQAFGKNFIFNMMKIVNKSFESTVDVVNTFRDIESSGVMVKSGFDSLWESANLAGVQLNDFGKYLGKISPTIAKLNANMQDGVKLFGESMNKISDAYGLTHDEQVAAFESTMEKLMPSQIRQMKEEELAQRVDETARNMKLLSLATGKSVENIKAENDAKSKTLRRQAYARSNPNADMFFKALNLSDEEVDYLLSGGVAITPDIVMKMANDQFYGAVMPELMRLSQSGGINDFGTIQSVMKKYAPLAQARESDVMKSGMNTALYSASTMSKLFETGVYSSFAGQGAQNLVGAPTFEEFQKLQDINNNVLQAAQKANEDHNKYVNDKLDAISGNTESMATFLKTYGLSQKALDLGWDTLNRLTKGTWIEGMPTQLLAGGISLFGPQIATGMASAITTGILSGFGSLLSPLITLVGGIAAKIGVGPSILGKASGLMMKGAKNLGLGGLLYASMDIGNMIGQYISETNPEAAKKFGEYMIDYVPWFAKLSAGASAIADGVSNGLTLGETTQLVNDRIDNINNKKQELDNRQQEIPSHKSEQQTEIKSQPEIKLQESSEINNNMTVDDIVANTMQKYVPSKSEEVTKILYEMKEELTKMTQIYKQERIDRKTTPSKQTIDNTLYAY